MWFNQYPYVNVNDLNLDYLLRAVRELRYQLENFININTIKYANPIQWNITTQYEANTVVIDANEGTAYLSVKPVPSGVAITNTDYWTPIFTLDLLSANQNLTLRDDGSNPLSTFSSVAGDWLIWGGVLYRVTQSINVNEAYVIGYNIERFTVELFIKQYINDVIAVIGDLNDLTTADKSSIVNAINELVNEIATLSSNVGDLGDLTTTDKTSIVNAINEVDGDVGALPNLNTRDKTNIVNAINEVFASTMYVNVKAYGAKGDGVTDDTNAIKNALAVVNIAGGVLYFPHGSYKISDTLHFTHYGSTMMGENAQSTYILQQADATAIKMGNGSPSPTIDMRVETIGIICQHSAPASTTFGIEFDWVVNSSVEDVVVGDFYKGVVLTHAGNTFLHNVGVVSTVYNAVGFDVGDASVSTSIRDVYVSFSSSAVDNGIGLLCDRGIIADLLVDYLDVGNGGYGVRIDGVGTPTSGGAAADLKFKNIVCDGQRSACAYISNLTTFTANITFDGGWLNPLVHSTHANCIRLDTVNNILITNVIFQQLAETTPTIRGITATGVTYLTVTNCYFINLEYVLNMASVDVVKFVCNTVEMYAGQTATTQALSLSGITRMICNDNQLLGNYDKSINVISGDVIIIKNNMYHAPIACAVTTQIVNDNIAV